jgi:hypothetical protein
MENLPQRTADSVFDEFLVSLDPPKMRIDAVSDTAAPVVEGAPSETASPAEPSSTAVEG